MPKPKLETPPLPPVYVIHDPDSGHAQWVCVIPGPTSRSGNQIFKGSTLQELVTALQRSAFHATWFLHEQNGRIKTLEAALSHKADLLNKLLQLPKGTR